MKAVRILKPNVLAVEEMPSQPRQAGEVRIRVEAVGVCGSDMAIINGSYPFSSYPLTPGHEFSGRVMEADPASKLRPGDLVTALPILTCGRCDACHAGQPNHCAQLKVLGVHRDGAYAEEIVLPERLVKTVPAGITAEQAALIEPTAVGVHINNRAGVRPGQSVAVIGSGVIGALIFLVARERGAEKALMIDRVDTRLELALELGANWAINSAQVDPVAFTAEHVGEGFDVVFDLVGAEATMDQAIRMTRPGGVVMMIAVPHGSKPACFNYQDVFRKELSLIGSRLYDERAFAQAIELVAAGRIRPERLVTHRMVLSEGPAAIELLRTQPDVAFKVLLRTK